jgi:hypothetical protein
VSWDVMIQKHDGKPPSAIEIPDDFKTTSVARHIPKRTFVTHYRARTNRSQQKYLRKAVQKDW